MNVYEIRNTAIEFVKDFVKEENDVHLNQLYPYYPLRYKECYKFKGTNISCGIYPKTEFTRRDPMTYLKLRESDRFLYNDNSQLVFKIIMRCDKGYWCAQPLIVFLDYISDNSFIILQYKGMGYLGVKYMNYQEIKDENNKVIIKISWVNNRNEATIFVFDKVEWREFQWIQERDPTKANFDWGNLDSEDKNILSDIIS